MGSADCLVAAQARVSQPLSLPPTVCSLQTNMQPKKTKCASKLKANALLLIGLGFLILSVTLPSLWATYYRHLISSELEMTPDSVTFQVWKDNPVPIYIEFFFFNWTNQDDLEKDGSFHIPQLQELGPYRFTEKIERVNITWNDNNTITYKQVKWWHFDQENSRGSLDDEIVTLNVVSLTAAFTIRDWNYFVRVGVSKTIQMMDQHIHIRRTVWELLFDGYSDRLIDMARSMPAFSNVKVPFDKFAWFYKRNGTSFMDGVFNMNTGVGDIQKIGKLENWNYFTSTDYFPGDCGKVEGTTGQLFPPGQTRTDKVRMFSPDLCRSISFEYSEDTVVNDIPGYKYVGGLSMLDNGTVFPDNECFCNGECVPSGVVNVTSCRFGAPAFASFPHFYLGDTFFTDNVRGLQPVKEKHQFYLVLEPTTGIPLDVAARFQINLLLKPLSGIRMYENVPTLFFPMLWFQQRATMPQEMAMSLRMLLWMRHLGVVIALIAVFTGILLISCSLLICLRICRMHSIQMEKEKNEANMYIATMDYPKMEKANINQYIVMKLRTKMDDPAKL